VEGCGSSSSWAWSALPVVPETRAKLGGEARLDVLEEGRGPLGPIELVGDDRVPEMGEVHAELVLAARRGPQGHQGEPGPPVDDLVFGHRG